MSKPTKKTAKRNRLSLLALESRMVFDGAIGVTDPHLADPSHGVDITRIAEVAVKSVALEPPVVRETSTRREIAFVDSALTDLPGLLDGIGSQVEVVFIQHERDGLSQINEALTGRGSFDAIHILAHGSAGVQTIGSTVLDGAHLDTLKSELTTLGANLNAQGDLLLYGCDVADSAQGQALIEQLAQFTGADVAASSNTTGNEGDWILEKTAGQVETDSLQAPGWTGSLTTSLTLPDDTLDGDGDGIVNRLDFDDDNDGILDSQEMEISLTNNLAVNSGFKDLSLAAISASIANGTYTDDQENPIDGKYATNPKPDPFSIIVPNAADATKLGWRTTSSDGAFEIWGDGMFDYKSADGDGQWMELSANEPSALYQYVDFKGQTLSPGATITVYWSSKHAGRDGIDTATVAFSLSEPAKQVKGQTPAPGAGEVVVATMVDGAGQWGAYSGAYEVTNNGTSDLQGVYIVFRAIKTGSKTLGEGNLLDDIRVSLSPPSDMDTDKDGIPNRLDLDSDGDHFSDSSEAGVPLDKLNGPVGPDGVYDSLQAAVPKDGVLAIKPPTYESQALVPNVYPTDLPPVEVIGDTFYENNDEYVGFSVTATPGQALVLKLTDAAEGDNAATTGLATQPLQYSLDEGTTWLTYTAGQTIYAAGDQVLVRTAMTKENDTLSEPDEQVKLTVQSWSGPTAQTAEGFSTVKDDDLPMAINNVKVTEGVDEYAQFTLTVNQGLSVTLTATSGTATLGTDTVTGMEYWNGTAWVPYTSAIAIPTDPANPEVKYELQVRFKVTDDVISEVPAGETFQLKATANVNGSAYNVTGTGTIVDPLVKQTLAITNAEVMEGLELYEVFKATGDSGLAVTISLKSDTALDPGDYLANSLQYSLDKGATWTNYSAGSTVNLNDAGEMLIRVKIVDDTAAESTESYKIIVGPPSPSFVPDGINWTRWTVATTGFDDDNPSGPIPMGYNPATGTYVAFTELDANGLPTMAGTPSSKTAVATSFLAAPENGSVYEALTFGGFILFPSNLQGQTISLRIPTTTGQYSVAWVVSTDGNLANWIDPVNATSKPLLDMKHTLVPGADGPVGAVSMTGVSTTGNLVDSATSTRLIQDFKATVTAGSSHAFYIMVTDPWNNRFKDSTFNFQYSTNGGSTWTAVPMTWYSSGSVAGSTTGSTGSTVLPVTGIGTILDNDALPNTPPAVPQVNDLRVNEGSPYAVFTVSGTEQQYVKLELTAGTATSGTDYTNAMEYWDGSSWQPYYADAYVKIPKDADTTTGEAASLLVRVAIKPDLLNDSGETFTLKAINTANASDTGVCTIVDDSTGTVFAASPSTTGVTPATNDAPAKPIELSPATTAVADPTKVTVADDDRPVTVDDVKVNEGSPYAVFTVGAKELQYVKLELAAGTAKASLDYINALEYWNGSSWVKYTAGTFVQTPADGDGTANEAANLLVRVAIKPDMLSDTGEIFTLKASNTGGGSDTGVGTIVDDGTGTVFGTTPAASGVTPATATAPAQPLVTPTASTPVADPAQQTVADDDRPLTVNNVRVNEGSPYAVMKVGGKEGQYVKLSLAEGTATADVDYTNGMEYWDGSSWKTYVPGTFVKIPADTDSTLNEPADLLVRVKITQDTLDDSGEVFTLKASNSGGGSATGQCTILNDGTGSVFGAANQTGNPDTLGVTQDPSLPAVLDDDRGISVSSVKVNEGSPYIVFDVTGVPGVTFSLGLAAGSAKLGSLSGNPTDGSGQDAAPALQYWSGTAWVDYTSGSQVTMPSGPLRVRVAVAQDSLYETSEAFTLTATDANARQAVGTGTIVDDGSGVQFVFSGNPNNTLPTVVNPPTANVVTPTAQSPMPDDDRPVLVDDLVVNEGSPFAVFSVSAAEGQYVKLELANGTATPDGDYADALEYFDGSAWRAYTPGSYVKAPIDGDTTPGTHLLVRVAIKQDTPLDGGETFTLTASNTGGASDIGTATIKDDGTGTLFATRADDPSTPNVNEAVLGVSGAAPVLDTQTVRDDDRVVNINDVRVNEGSPYIVFTVSGDEGAAFRLQPTSATAVLGQDTGTQFEYFNGSNWVAYTAGSYLNLPDNGNPSTTASTMLVRLAVKQDLPYEVSESFKLSAINPGGNSGRVGTGTIVDDGTGTLFATRADDPSTAGVNEAVSGVNPDGTPVLNSSSPKDDDRPLTVTGSTVQEPGTGQTGYLPFTVSGIEGQPVMLALGSDSGTVGTDTGTQLQYWSGSAWVNYDPLNPPTIPQVGAGLNGETGTLNVRVAVNPDTLTEGTETVKLVATNLNGTAFSAPGYILEGAGTVVPDAPPIAVTGQTVNEASPYLVYKVSGLIGQGLSLDLKTTGTGNGHVDTDADISCHLPVTTVNVLTNDVASVGNIDPATVLLFSTATGAETGVSSLVVPGQGTYVANANGTVSFTPIDGLQEGTSLTPVYYTVKTVPGGYGRAESGFGKIDLNQGALAASSGTPQTSPWWQVDLGANVAIDSIKVSNRQENPSRLNGASVYILDANQQVVSSFLLSSNHSAASVETLTASGATGRYVKVTLPTMEYLSLAEVEVYSGTSNVALGKTASQSSTGWGGFARLAVDGNTGATFAGGSVTHTDSVLPPVTANDGTPGGMGAHLSCQELEYFDGTNWVYYVPGTTVNIPGATNGQPGELLVRARVVNDGIFEGPETLDLVATSTNGYVASGTGTVVDDGTGLINTNTVSNGAPVLDTSTTRNDDRGATPSVNSFTVNEASPFAVFTITGVPGAGLTLGLGNGSAEPEDHGTALEFFDVATSSWKPYDATTPNAVVQPDGRLLVRVALNNDVPFEGPETFNLNATYNNKGVTQGITLGGSTAGTATIVDDGTGVLFLTHKDDPLTPADESNLGVMDSNQPQFDDITLKDDDRGVSVADVTVNEGSGYIVFSLDSFVGQKLSVSLSNGTAKLGDVTQSGMDASDTLEYWTGSAWVPYVPGSPIEVTPNGNQLPGEAKSVPVRLKINNDNPYEASESFTITATTAGGKSDSALGTIVDNGTGTKWTFSSPSSDVGTSQTALTPTVGFNDDRPVNPAFVNDLRINEGSPWAVFTITGVPSAQVSLALPAGTGAHDARLGDDYGDGSAPGELQVYVGGQWVDYNPSAVYAGSVDAANKTGNAVLDNSGKLLVRVKLANQVDYEGPEPFSLAIQYTGNYTTANLGGSPLPQPGYTFTGSATIVDDGSGVVFGDTNVTGTPTTPGADGTPALLDDDRPLVVGDAEVNEASPYIVMPVSGKAGQLVKLDLKAGSATLSGGNADTGAALQYWNGTGWVDYVAGSYVAIPTLPGQVSSDPQTLLVRLAVVNDVPYERRESFTLTATNTGGSSDDGLGTIWDNGTGPIYATGVPGNPSGVTVQGNTYTAVQLPTAPLNDDRTVAVNSVRVNEASPFAVFTVDAAAGELITLNLTSGTASVGVDTANSMEYFDPVSQAWMPYTAPMTVPLTDGGANTKLLVRVGIKTDPAFEGDETFTLKAQYTTGNQASATGTGIISDDGAGDIFATRKDDPATPVNDSVKGVNTDGTPLILIPANTLVADPTDPADPDLMADDDRPLRVNDIEVNESSPFMVWTVKGKQGQYVQLDLGSTGVGTGHAVPGQDTGTQLQYWNGAVWENYQPGTFVKVPRTGAGTDGQLLVRVAVNNDQPFENRETLTLTASNTGGSSDVGLGTIKDDGTGTIYLSGLDDPSVPGVQNPSGVGADGLPQVQAPSTAFVVTPGQALIADNDRPMTVNDVTVNEASPYLVWTVGARQGQYVSLALGSTGTGDGFATLGTDTGSAEQLQVFNGTAWVDYVPGTLVRVPGTQPTTDGQLLVRVAVKNDYLFEDIESLKLTAANPNGTTATGLGRIRDDGQGLLFGKDNTTAVPDTTAALGLPVLDDDRVAPTIPQAVVTPPPQPEPPAPPTAPALHVQQAVSDGRQAVSITNGGSTAAVVAARVMGSRAEGMNELHRTEQLIDKFDRPTDPNLYVLPQVKDTRYQSSDAKIPSIVMQSGLLMEELNPQNSVGALVKISQGPTSADQTLAELMQDKAAEQALARAQQEADEASLGEKLAAHLLASREAIKLEAQERQERHDRQAQARGQMGFSKQLQMARRSAAGAASYQG